MFGSVHSPNPYWKVFEAHTHTLLTVLLRCDLVHLNSIFPSGFESLNETSNVEESGLSGTLNVQPWIAVSCICPHRTAKYFPFFPSHGRSGHVISIIRDRRTIHMVMRSGVNGSCSVKFVSGVGRLLGGIVSQLWVRNSSLTVITFTSTDDTSRCVLLLIRTLKRLMGRCGQWINEASE